MMIIPKQSKASIITNQSPTEIIDIKKVVVEYDNNPELTKEIIKTS